MFMFFKAIQSVENLVKCSIPKIIDIKFEAIRWRTFYFDNTYIV